MRYRFQHRDRVYEVELDREGTLHRLLCDGQPFAFEVLEQQPGQVSLLAAGRSSTVHYAARGAEKWFSLDGCTYRLEPPAAVKARSEEGESAGLIIRAPMPAKVRALEMAEGDTLEQGQTILLLEAMKMEIRVRAPSGGKLLRLAVAAGQTVDKDQILAEIGE